jgi:hypothetical protein
LIILDANDINYLVNNFSPDQLRAEISNAREKLKREIDWKWQAFYEDYIKACHSAISIQYKPKPHKNPKFRESIEEIKARYDLVDYISQHVKLRKSGNKFQGLCPFHADKKTPSFFVYPTGWHCFGCLESGDIITFVSKYKNMSIKDAIEDLARF